MKPRMKPNEMLRLVPGCHVGYQIKSISWTAFTEGDLYMFRRLERVPNKISAYLHRDKIKAVYKSDCFGGDPNDYYLVLAIDGTLFHDVLS